MPTKDVSSKMQDMSEEHFHEVLEHRYHVRLDKRMPIPWILRKPIMLGIRDTLQVDFSTKHIAYTELLDVGCRYRCEILPTYDLLG